MPTGVRGWAALLGFVLASSLAVMLLMRVGASLLPPLALVPVVLLLTTGAIMAFMRWVVIGRGREANMP